MNRRTVYRAALVIIGSVALAVGLVACAAESDPAASTMSVDTDASPSVSAPVPVPHIAFDGDCTAALSEADASAVLGAPSTVAEGTWVESNALRTDGGLSCSYEDASYPLRLVALPTSVAQGTVAAAYAVPSCLEEYLRTFCFTSRVVGETWILAGVHVPWDADAEPVLTNPVDLEPIVDIVARNAETQTQPLPNQPTAQWWELRPCADLTESLRIQAPPGAAAFTVQEGDLWPSNIIDLVATEIGVLQECSWTSDGSAAVSVALLPGAGARWEQVAIDGGAVTDIEIPGAQSARLGEDTEGRFIVVTDGTNTGVVRGRGLAVEAIAAALIANG